MCRDAGLECLVVAGTCSGEARFWNMIQTEDGYAHLDLLACQEREEYSVCTDEQMKDYVWDYSAYPVCVGRQEPDLPAPRPEETVPQETVPEETGPQETVSEETLPEETVPQETTPGDTVPEETVPEESVTGETQSADTQPT